MHRRVVGWLWLLFFFVCRVIDVLLYIKERKAGSDLLTKQNELWFGIRRPTGRGRAERTHGFWFHVGRRGPCPSKAGTVSGSRRP
jgi:hypothetical protein